MLSSLAKFSAKKQKQLEEVNNDIQEMEEYEDEFEIFQNKLIAGAYLSAKKKTIQRIVKDQAFRAKTKIGSPERL